jgi:ABC-2 type transport system permease protein
MSGALGSIGQSQEKDTRTPLPVVNLDNGALAQALLDGIDRAGGVRVEPYTEADATTALDEAAVPFVLTIPQGFTADVDAGRPTGLRFVVHKDADRTKAEAVRLVIDGVARDISLQIQLLAALAQMGQMQAGSPEAAEAFSVERMQAQAMSQYQSAAVQPLVDIVQKVPGQEVEREEDEGLTLADVAVPGIAVLFVFMTAQNTARSIFDEKQVGSFRRLLAAPMSKATLLIGKMLPNFITGLVQLAVIFAFGIFGFRLLGLTPITLGKAPLAVLLVAVVLSICSSAFGVLLAALARTPNQIGGLSTLLLWIMGVLGGAFVPLFLLERFLGPVPKIVPHYWANHALTNLMVRGLGLADISLDLLVLLGFTALFFAIGLWRFDFD